jgi:hypothetical protein
VSEELRDKAARVVKLAEEVEVSGEVSLDQAAILRDRAALHAWVDTAVGVVLTPGFARVTLLHENGTQSTIGSWDLCLAMSLERNAPAEPKAG